MVRCKDYFIIKIRYYADSRLMKEWEEKNKSDDRTPLPQQFYERVDKYTDFIWKFIEKMTGETAKSWHLEYPMEAKACALDEIEEKHGIRFADGEGWATFMIPKQQEELLEWMKANANLPFKIVTKTHLGYLGREHDLTWRRQRYAAAATKSIFNP